jgi:hypothetical protein
VIGCSQKRKSPQELLLGLKGIDTSAFNSQLSVIRELAMKFSADMQVPGMTSSVATTFAGVGLCQELSQRFVLEYVENSRKQDVAVIFISQKGRHTPESHAFVFIGEISVPEALFVGRGSALPTITFDHTLTLNRFIDSHAAKGVFIDPLLGCVGSARGELEPLFDYSRRYGLNIVCGVRDYSRTVGLVEAARNIRTNAEIVAGKVKETLVLVPLCVGLTRENIDYVTRLAFVVNGRGAPLIEVSPQSKSVFFDRKWLGQVAAYHASQPDGLRRDILAEMGAELGCTIRL